MNKPEKKKAAEAVAAPAPKAAKQGSGNGGSIRILIAEDHTVNGG